MSTNPEIDTSGEVPDRSLSQRKEALARANKIRLYRAQLKRDLKAGNLNLVELIRKPPEMLKTMKVYELLVAKPRFGRVKVNKILNRCHMSPSKTFGEMSMRQRAELVQELLRYET